MFNRPPDPASSENNPLPNPKRRYRITPREPIPPKMKASLMLNMLSYITGIPVDQLHANLAERNARGAWPSEESGPAGPTPPPNAEEEESN